MKLDYYPEWLGKDLISDTLPWKHALKVALPAFLDQYTLHDSYWIGLYLMPQQTGILIVRWDTFWTKGRVPFPGSKVAEWPLLICQLSGLQQVEVALVEDGISNVSSRPLTQNEQGGLSSSKSVEHQYTQIESHAGGKAHFVHDPIVSALCLSRRGNIIEIPFQNGAA